VTTLTTAMCFLLALVLTPLFLAVPAAATAPALVVVGVFHGAVGSRDRDEGLRHGGAAVLTLLAIPLTFSIAEGSASA
jgi:AGZA family xanthine/uracil permease-like MFS transporter